MKSLNITTNNTSKLKRLQLSIALLLCTFLSFTSNAQNIIGAWESISTAKADDQMKIVVIYTEGYKVLTAYNSKTGKFIGTTGGSWKLNGDTLTEKIEFDSGLSERVGLETNNKVTITDSTITTANSPLKLKRIDSGKPGKLQGAWLMSGRVKDGETQQRDTSKPRKTMKILSGTRFQWIAYNTETKQFMGTGGGTYTTKDGKYTENIEFFSKDDTRVGNSLQFDYELKEGNWHHSGLSSKGAPIYEIWSVRK